MILDDIKTKLSEVDPSIYYGMVENLTNEILWNYIVFNRVKLSHSQSKLSRSDYFDVHIIRENFIPDGIAELAIEKLLEIDGMRLTSEDGTYNYMRKPNTEVVLEALTLHFVRPRK